MRRKVAMASSFSQLLILQRLQELDRHDPQRKLFGANSHQYRLHPPVAHSDVAAFEAKYNVTLPDDYRVFITEIGNGGAGPYYGLFPFGEHDDNADGTRPWQDGDLVGDLSAAFVHADAWNVPQSFWEKSPDVGADTSPDDEDVLWEAWDEELKEHYWNPTVMNGAIPLCHRGCALRQWLVIKGPQRGFVWNDDRADEAGVYPLRDDQGRQLTFADWYMAWLTNADRAKETSPVQTLNVRGTARQLRADWVQLFLLICVGLAAFAAYLAIRVALGYSLPGDRMR